MLFKQNKESVKLVEMFDQVMYVHKIKTYGVLAKKLGVTSSNISAYIAGTRDVPLHAINKFYEIFQIPRDEKKILAENARLKKQITTLNKEIQRLRKLCG